MKRTLIVYGIVAVVFSLFSFGFVDPHFPISTHPWVSLILTPLTRIVYQLPRVAEMIYTALLVALFILYARILREKNIDSLLVHRRMLCVIGVLFFLSYPAFSHDIFNYILTAKLAFFYRENPYVVMPTELLGESMLGFTRAANKFALYGPIWILATCIPHMLSFGNVFVAVYTFKLLVVSAYIAICFLLYTMTKDIRRVVFFAFNPLVIIETFVSGHNDAFMMALVLYGIYLWRNKRLSIRIIGWIFMFASVFVKGATIVLLPLFLFFRTLSYEKRIFFASACMFGVFLLTPLREELYPWYAIWWIVFVSLLPVVKRSYLQGAVFMLSFGLMLRYLPWIGTREYGGTGPMIRFFVTTLPVLGYTVWYRFLYKKK